MMPALIKTEIVGEVVWLGYVPDRQASLRSTAVTEVDLTYAGIPGEAHGGLTRQSCSRVTSQHKRGTEIRNVRQLCVMADEELTQIAARCGLDYLDPAYAGASMVLRGIPDLTHLPPSSRLQFADGSVVVVDMENHPCHLPAKVIDIDHPGVGDRFKAAAKDRRGVTAWIERQGHVRLGDAVTLHIPAQRPWQP